MPLIFAYPALFAGAVTAVAPWIIHLLMRPRPRRVIFPALAMLRPALAEGRRASRVRHLVLLALRSILLGVLAALLAGPACVVARPAAGIGVVNILIVDDSASMRFREGGGTIGESVRTAAISLLEAERAASPASNWRIFRTSSGASDEIESSVVGVLRALAEPSDLADAATLATPLRSASSAIRRMKTPARMVIATDMAAHAWRDISPGLFESDPTINVVLLHAGAVDRANLAVVSAVIERPIYSDADAGSIAVDLATRGFRSNAVVEVHEIQTDSQEPVLLTRIELPIDRDGVVRCSLSIPALAAGPHVLRATVTPSDRLDFDQSCYVVVRSSPRPRVLVPSVSSDTADLGLAIVENLLAPASLAQAAQPVLLRRIGGITLFESAKQADVVILSSDVMGDAASLATIKKEIERGLNVVLLPAVHSTGDWAGLLNLVVDVGPRRLDTPSRIRWSAFQTGSEARQDVANAVGEVESRSGAASSESAPRVSDRRGTVQTGAATTFLDPAGDVGLADLASCRVTARLACTPATGSVVHAEFHDGVPALWSRALGRGRIWFIATSPDPTWSELGQRAAGLLTLLHRIVAQAGAATATIPTFRVGESTREALPGLPKRRSARVRSLTDPSAEAAWINIESGLPQRDWPTATAGVFAVTYSGAKTADDHYVVAWPAEESDLTPISPEEIARRLGVQNIEVLSGSRPTDRSELKTRLFPVEYAAESVIALVLIGTLLVELVVANRSAG